MFYLLHHRPFDRAITRKPVRRPEVAERIGGAKGRVAPATDG